MADYWGPSSILARSWWVVGLRGVAALIFGVLAFLMPGITLLSLVLLFAAYLIVDAVLAIVAGIRAIRHHQRWWSLLLEGVLDAAAAVAALMWPGLTALVLVWIVAAWAIFTGVTGLMVGAVLPAAHGRVLQALSAAVSIALGVLMIAMPLVGLLALVYWIAAYAVLFGILQLALSARLYRRHHGRVRASE